MQLNCRACLPALARLRQTKCTPSCYLDESECSATCSHGVGGGVFWGVYLAACIGGDVFSPQMTFPSAPSQQVEYL